MKIHSPAVRSRERGVALVIVLASLVLLVAIVMAFFIDVTSDSAASAQFEESVASSLLADTAVNAVIGQIQAATADGDLAWASQPGVIRTFNATGMAKAFKLYSDDQMVVDNVAGLFTDVPASWSEGATTTDLNRPAIVKRGATTTTYYPIVDPRAQDGANPVEGFSINSAPGATSAQPAPMPASWLYVLQDGQIVAPTGGGNSASVASATPGNPIVGRIAFWTDDESCKLNINTASDGVAWDIPRAYTKFDYETSAKFQPAQHEIQRYPGHPAMTSLRPVFPRLKPDTIAGVIPRVTWGGSEGGTKPVPANGTLPYDNDRLYASLDELLFQPDRALNSDTDSAVSEDKLESSRFFLTTNSRAPETNLFNRPRVTIWPVDNRYPNPAYTTPYDRSIAFASTIGDRPYYFKRQKSDDRNWDWNNITSNRDLLGYLFRSTDRAIPGFGGKFTDKYKDGGSPMPRDRILVAIFDYIRSTNISDPALGANAYAVAGGKTVGTDPPPGYGQVVPSLINISSLPGASSLSDARGFGRFPTMSEVAIWCVAVGDFAAPAPETTPTEKDALRGIDGVEGTPDDLVQMQAVFIVQMYDPSQGFPVLHPSMTLKIKGLDKFQYGIGPAGSVAWTDLEMPTEAQVFSDTYMPILYHGRAFGGPIDFRFWTRVNGRWGGSGGKQWVSDARSLGTAANNYPFFSKVVAVPKQSNLHLRTDTGASISMEIFNGDTTAGPQRVQTIQNIQFPATETPAPKKTDPALGGWSNNSFNQRIARSSSNPSWKMFSSDDVVRSLVPKPTTADFRTLAMNGVVSGSYQFQPHKNYNTTTQRLAHSLRLGIGDFFEGGSGGFFVKPAGYDANAVYNFRRLPQVPPAALNVTLGYVPQGGSQAPGDWDNGIGSTADGVFINKPDEGAAKPSSGSIPYFEETQSFNEVGQALFSPNRQVPSAGMFGSIPNGIFSSQRPYRTLLFRPDPARGTSKAHFSSTISPPDHLLLDLFTMPVVEPWLISDSFSTAGKVNMNQQILPFSYIKRDTALRGVLASEKLLIIPNSAMTTSAALYKEAPFKNYRFDIDADETLKQFTERFTAQNIFVSPSEICDLHLVPKDHPSNPTAATMGNFGSFWENNLLTGDNSRERPYTNLYPRLTTKSNVFTVYYTVQSLKKIANSPQGSWDETKDVVTGERRGSTTIERYIDPADSRIPDYADDYAADTLDQFYKFRVLNTRIFAP